MILLKYESDQSLSCLKSSKDYLERKANSLSRPVMSSMMLPLLLSASYHFLPVLVDFLSSKPNLPCCALDEAPLLFQVGALTSGGTLGNWTQGQLSYSSTLGKST
jgi:hypothetical protein